MPPRKRKEPQASSSTDVVPAKMKVAELREELESRGLDSTGKKAELVARLEVALPAAPPSKKEKVADPVAEETDFSKAMRVLKSSEPQASSSSTDVVPAKMKVAELREELESRGLDSTGKKAELVARLEAALPAAPPSKKGKVADPVAEETDFSKAMRVLKSSEPRKKKRQRKVDVHVPLSSSYEVEGDWDCMLNQTNIGQNNNKYYVIQMLSKKMTGRLYVWNRWGRVGEPGQNALKGPFGTVDQASQEFCKKFRDKTKNTWEDRQKFTPAPGKYTLIEMDDDDEDEQEVAQKLAALDEPDAPPRMVRACSLDQPTRDLVKLIFDNDMFREAMKSMEIDTKKMPLGKLSKPQIAKGFEALEAIEDALKTGSSGSKLAELTSRFYTIIPHDFGRRVPPTIRDHETLQKKFDMLLVLGDIEIAQGLQRDTEKKEKEGGGEEVPHPLDMNYQLLKAQLQHVDKTKEQYAMIERYLKATEPQWRRLQIMDMWEVNREGEGDRFSEHSAVGNRKLLWHGTKVAVVAAILKSGLRIMPHSGGRVGRGIYFASENSKSAGYVGCAGNNIGIMLLNEVVLGKEHHITRDDSTITTPPTGYDSVVAKGRTEPDPKVDVKIKLEGRDVVVPQGKPIHMPKYSSSSFSQSEYLVYRESQARIRYLLKLKF